MNRAVNFPDAEDLAIEFEGQVRRVCSWIVVAQKDILPGRTDLGIYLGRKPRELLTPHERELEADAIETFSLLAYSLESRGVIANVVLVDCASKPLDNLEKELFEDERNTVIYEAAYSLPLAS